MKWRGQARYYREQTGWCRDDKGIPPVGFGNTRVIRHQKGK